MGAKRPVSLVVLYCIKRTCSRIESQLRVEIEDGRQRQPPHCDLKVPRFEEKIDKNFANYFLKNSYIADMCM